VSAVVARLTGVSFVAGYPRNLLDLVERIGHDGALLADVVRDLDNPEDLNATGVELEGRRLGWLPRPIAADVAPRIDAGAKMHAVVWRIAVDLDHRDKPGVDVMLAVAS
jgi:hypothetical protein